MLRRCCDRIAVRSDFNVSLGLSGWENEQWARIHGYGTDTQVNHWLWLSDSEACIVLKNVGRPENDDYMNLLLINASSSST